MVLVRIAPLHSWQAAAVREEGEVVGAAPSAEEKLQVNDATGGDLAGQEERPHPLGHRIEVNPDQSRRVGRGAGPG